MLQRMWNVKSKVIPLIIGATGTISESLRKYVSNIPGKHEVKELQKTSTCGVLYMSYTDMYIYCIIKSVACATCFIHTCGHIQGDVL